MTASILILLLTAEAVAGTVAVVPTGIIPNSTVEVIDPMDGVSAGAGSTDLRIAPGDVITLHFALTPLTAQVRRGLQSYLTFYIPQNTEVVGVRTLDAAGRTVPPRLPGIAPDGCGSSCNGFDAVPCEGGTCDLDDGTISQVYADTGFFYTDDARLAPTPDDQPLTVGNGDVMSPEPQAVGSVKPLIGMDGTDPARVHNAWDHLQVRSFGTANAASDNGGTGNTPFGYGSPVAGPQTFYSGQPSEPTAGQIEFNGEVGPWQRVFSPGSRIGFGLPVDVGGEGGAGRNSAAIADSDPNAGVDLTPAMPLPTGTKAVRVAAGEARVGEPMYAELALRVVGTPLNPQQGADIVCAEIAVGDGSQRGTGQGAQDAPWATHLGAPDCVPLNTKFDLDVDEELVADEPDAQSVYTIRGRNLSMNDQTNSVVTFKYDSSRLSFVSATGSPTLNADCDGDGLDCLIWPTMALAPSETYDFAATFDVIPDGQVHNTAVARYASDQRPTGYERRVHTVVEPLALPAARLLSISETAAAGGTADVEVTLANDGTAPATFGRFTPFLPPGWTVVDSGGAVTPDVVFGGVRFECVSDCGSNTPGFDLSAAMPSGQARTAAFSVNVPSMTATDLHPIHLQLWASQVGAGGAFETFFSDVVSVPVGALRSERPSVACPVDTSSAEISGSAAESDGTEIAIRLNGIERDVATVSGGSWSGDGFGSSFGALYPGVEVDAIAVAPGELASEPSEPCVVTTPPDATDATLACGQVVTGEITLTENLGPCPGDGLLIGAPGITIDLNGHTLQGSGVGHGIVLAPGTDADDVVIRNGRVAGFGTGLTLPRGTRSTLVGLELLGHEGRGAVLGTDKVVVANVITGSNGSDGLLARSEGRTVIRGAVARNNARHGFFVTGSQAAVVRNSTATGNGRYGIFVRAERRTVATGNRSHRNGHIGIRSTAPVATINGNAMVANASFGLVSPDRPRVGGDNVARNNNDGRRQCRPDRLC